jgi:hypothetical protein
LPTNHQQIFLQINFVYVKQVFSQPDLNTMLREVEQCLDDASGAHLANGSVSSRNSPETSHQGHKWNALVRQQVLELEGPGYQYKPLFGSETLSQVFFLFYRWTVMLL